MTGKRVNLRSIGPPAWPPWLFACANFVCGAWYCQRWWFGIGSLWLVLVSYFGTTMGLLNLWRHKDRR